MNRAGALLFFNDRNGFINYSAYGLPMEVRNIVEDKEGRMWVGTMDGLISFDGNFSNVSDIKFEAYRGRMRRLMLIVMYANYIKTVRILYGPVSLVED